MPFRRLALSMGAGLATTELISAKGLIHASARTKSYLLHDKTIEKPFSVQLFGGEAKVMAQASEIVVGLGADIIDINMGCPVKKVTKTNAGSALMCDIKRATEIVKAMKESVGSKIPITAKIRSGWDDDHLNYEDFALALEDAGVSALAIHPRTRAQGYSGKASWDHIAKLKLALKIPIIGNGDITCANLALKMMQYTGCDAVMIGRAALGNPWIFSEISNKAVTFSRHDRCKLIKQHLAEHLELHKMIASSVQKPYSENVALKNFRSHLHWYSKGYRYGNIFRTKVNITSSLAEICDLIDDFFINNDLADVVNDSDDGIDYRQAFG